MASNPLVYTDAYVDIDATDVSDDVEQVAIALTADQREITTMGSGGAREYKNGLVTGTVTMTLIQDYGSTGLDSILFALMGGDPAELTLRPTAAAAGSDNPEFTGTANLADYSGPIDGTVGDVAKASVTFQVSGTITRGTGA